MGLAVGRSGTLQPSQAPPTAVKAVEGHHVALVSFESGVPVPSEL